MGKWSTKAVNELLQRVDKSGVMPRDNPFHMGKTQWRKENIPFAYTKEELLEMAKCHVNIIHFAETHCKVMTDEGHRKVKMRNYQRKVLLQLRKYQFNVWLSARQIGKCVTFDTIVTILSPVDNKYHSLPIFRLHYEFKEHKVWWDRLEYRLFGMLYKTKKRIERLERELA